MKCALLFVALLALANAAVVKLDAENFDDVVGHDLPVFIKFYAPWCGHCKALAPTWVQLGDTFSEKDGVIIAEVDADHERDLSERFGITGFPTLKFFPKNEADKPIDYAQSREIASLVSFVNEQTGLHKIVREPTSNVFVLTPANFEETIKSKPYVFVKFYAPWCGHCKALAPKYIELANIFVEDSDIVIAELDADKYRDLASQYDIRGFPTLKLFINGEPMDYQGNREVEALFNFIKEHTGTARNMDGSLEPTYGHLSEFDEIIAKFPNLVEEDLEKAKEILNQMKDKNAEFAKTYVAIIKKIIKNGASFVDKEKARVSKMLQSDSINNVKKGAFRLRQNILNYFK